jgi:peptidylprolyl isomerase
MRDLVAAEDRAVEPVPRRTALGIVGTVAGLAQGALPTEAAEDGAAYTEGPEGLLFSDDKVGTGLEPIEGDVVTCNYEGSLVATGTRFDSAKFFTFGVGTGEVIRAWDLALVGGDSMPPMAVGGTRRIRVPAALAYGSRGAGCRPDPSGGKTCVIPPEADLDFTISLVKIK